LIQCLLDAKKEVDEAKGKCSIGEKRMNYYGRRYDRILREAGNEIPDIKSARQDVEAPMFTQKRSYPGNGGGGSTGFVLLLALLLLGVFRLSLSVYDRVKSDRKE
jgi:hypothetical protein